MPYIKRKNPHHGLSCCKLQYFAFSDMRSSTAANVLAFVAIFVTPALAETIHGLLLFTRHGDRMFESLWPIVLSIRSDTN